jgi:hypothetical protein
VNDTIGEENKTLNMQRRREKHKKQTNIKYQNMEKGA